MSKKSRYYRPSVDMKDKERIAALKRELIEKKNIPPRLLTERNLYKILWFKNSRYKINLSKEQIMRILLS